MSQLYFDLMPRAFNPLSYSEMTWEDINVIFKQLGTNFTMPNDRPRLTSLILKEELKKLRRRELL